MWPHGDASPVEKLWISLLLKIVIVEVKIPMNGGEEAREGASMLLEWCVNRSVCPEVPGQFARHLFSTPVFSDYGIRPIHSGTGISRPSRSRIVPFKRMTPHSQHHGNECQHKQ